MDRKSKKRRVRSPSASSADRISTKTKRVDDNKEVSEKPKNKDAFDANIYTRTGGAYIPPARLRQMQAAITDKTSEAYQRIAWEALKKSIHGFINKVNVSNITEVVKELFSENVIRGRGLFVRSILTAQFTSPTFTHVFAALIAIVNSKFPKVGELVLKRLINEFRKAFRRNQKDRCLSSARFLAHLVNQKVVHELIILELLTLLLEQTTDDSMEVAIAVLKECGAMLTRYVPKGVHGIFEHLRRILNEGQCDKRISYMLEVMFQIRRDGWKDHPIVLPDLDLIQENDQITHTLSLLDQLDPENQLNIFRHDPDFVANEEKYNQIKASLLDTNEDSEDDSEGSSDDDEGGEGDSSSDDEDGDRAHGASAKMDTEKQQDIIDRTETNLIHLRRTIYLMLQSSLSADEAAHRLLQLKIKPGEEYEVASMVLDCCAQTRSYETRYGQLGQRLCRVVFQPMAQFDSATRGTVTADPELGPGSRYRNKSAVTAKPVTKADNPVQTNPQESAGPPRSYVTQFERIFVEQYAIIHRLETVKLRNVAFLFSHLLYTDSISWGVFDCVKLNERDTTSSGRIFLKHLFLELCSYMGLSKLQARLRDETLQPFFTGLLPRDNPKDTRFAINFLTTIGLGGLTLDLREHLQASREAALAKKDMEARIKVDFLDKIVSSDSSAASSTSSSSPSSSSSSSSSSESDDSDDSALRNRHHYRKHANSKAVNDVKRKSSKHTVRNDDLNAKPGSHSKRTINKDRDIRDDDDYGHRDHGRHSRRQISPSHCSERSGLDRKDHHHHKSSKTRSRKIADTPFFDDRQNSPSCSQQLSTN